MLTATRVPKCCSNLLKLKLKGQSEGEGCNSRYAAVSNKCKYRERQGSRYMYVQNLSYLRFL